MMKNCAKMILAGLLCAAPALGQKDLLTAAHLAAHYKHDYGAATKLYRKVANNKKRSRADRMQAWLGLGTSLWKCGQVDAARKALRQAAEDDGDIGKQARTMLQQGSSAKDLLQAKVELAIRNLQHGDKGAESELKWIGAPAVPFLVKALREEKRDLTFITNVATLLTSMGDAASVQALADLGSSKDLLRKRAVLKGFRKPMVRLALPLARKLEVYLKDEDPAVRRDAVGGLARQVPAEKLFVLLGDNNASVASEAAGTILGQWRKLRHQTQASSFAALLPHLHPEHGKAIQRNRSKDSLKGAFVRGLFKPSDEGYRLYFKAILHPAFRHGPLGFPIWHRKGAPRPRLVAEVMATARAIAALPAKQRTWPKSNFESALWVGRLGWGYAQLDQVLELTSLGMPPWWESRVSLESWLGKNLKDSDTKKVFKLLSKFRQPGELVKLVGRRGGSALNAEAFGHLSAFAKQQVGRATQQDLMRTLRAVLDTGAPGVPDFFFALIHDRSTTAHGFGAAWAINLLCGDEYAKNTQVHELLCRLLVLEKEGEFTVGARAKAFAALVRWSVPGAVQLYAKAYKLGLPQDDDRFTGLFMAGGKLRRDRYQDADLVRIYRSCLATGLAQVWLECINAIQLAPPAVVTELANVALDCPPKRKDGHSSNRLRARFCDQLVLSHGANPAVHRMILGCYASSDAYLVREVVGVLMRRVTAMRNDRVARATMKLIVGGDANSAESAALAMKRWRQDLLGPEAEQLLKTTKHGDAKGILGQFLLETKKGDAIPLVEPLIRNGNVRSSGLILALADTVDRRAIPVLLHALRGPNSKRAKAALEKIRFYHEQKRVWDRLQNDAGLNAASAAEALIKQAKAGNKKAVRLTAIRSLGTLSVPETLPFLIQLMSESDQEIIQAAKQAADRINAAAKKKK